MDVETYERETASFEVELSHADVEGVWQKDGLRIKPSNAFRVSSNGLVHGLTLSNLTMEDTGSIVFMAEGLRTTSRLVVKGESEKESRLSLSEVFRGLTMFLQNLKSLLFNVLLYVKLGLKLIMHTFIHFKSSEMSHHIVY